MSSDRRPAKVRVVNSSAVQAVPARRRSDIAQDDGDQATSAIAAAPARQGGSPLWVVGSVVLFLAGCAIGGALFVLSGFAAGAQL
ncbi:hypothetical protein V474_24150 [Novosphingobium barchaimii LL02]|uniref:Uncharacterized protein n=1 Tax=Novosphingobium barchaimii LL02 TaxID=1114963 RepID=A0A0J7XMM9_9SPHN|nr:hypothetical protein [Novosphingobium barchaimii]KMS52937.1 hypothetical protein V474_24150 [Novosphingobium barchaimii LL02]